MKTLTVVSATLIALAFAGSSSANAQSSQEQIIDNLESVYGVEVLRIKETTNHGTPSYEVTMMNPPGDYNEAFQVNTIVVDRENGQPVPQFREGTNGIKAAAPPVGRRTRPRLAATP